MGSGGSRFSQTTWGCQPPTLKQKPVIWQDFCSKMHENERSWTERGAPGTHVPRSARNDGLSENIFNSIRKQKIQLTQK